MFQIHPGSSHHYLRGGHVVSGNSKESSREVNSVGDDLISSSDTSGTPPGLALLGVVVPLHVTWTPVHSQSAVSTSGVVLAGLLGLLGVVAAVSQT